MILPHSHAHQPFLNCIRSNTRLALVVCMSFSHYIAIDLNSHVSSPVHSEASPRCSSYRRTWLINCAQGSCLRCSIAQISSLSMAVAIHDRRPCASTWNCLLGSLFANPSLQRADTLVLVPDPPDLPFGLLQLADGIDPVVE